MSVENHTQKKSDGTRLLVFLVCLVIPLGVFSMLADNPTAPKGDRQKIDEIGDASEWQRGFDKAKAIGFANGQSGASVPTAMGLTALANYHSKIDLGRYDDTYVSGFSRGYESGYKLATAKAF